MSQQSYTKKKKKKPANTTQFTIFATLWDHLMAKLYHGKHLFLNHLETRIAGTRKADNSIRKSFGRYPAGKLSLSLKGALIQSPLQMHPFKWVWSVHFLAHIWTRNFKGNSSSVAVKYCFVSFFLRECINNLRNWCQTSPFIVAQRSVNPITSANEPLQVSLICYFIDFLFFFVVVIVLF